MSHDVFNLDDLNTEVDDIDEPEEAEEPKVRQNTFECVTEHSQPKKHPFVSSKYSRVFNTSNGSLP